MIVLTNLAGLLITFGFVSVAHNLITGQVEGKRKPVYWLALVMSAALIGIYLDFLHELIRGNVLLPGWSIRVAFVSAYILLGCLLILVPWVDRREHRDRDEAAAHLERTLGEHEDDQD